MPVAGRATARRDEHRAVYALDAVQHADEDQLVRARAGEPATVMLGNDSYTLRIVTTTDAERRVDVDAEVSFWTPTGLRYTRDEVGLTANGETGTFAFPATDPATGETRDVRIEFSVVPAGD